MASEIAWMQNGAVVDEVLAWNVRCSRPINCPALSEDIKVTVATVGPDDGGRATVNAPEENLPWRQLKIYKQDQTEAPLHSPSPSISTGLQMTLP